MRFHQWFERSKANLAVGQMPIPTLRPTQAQSKNGPGNVLAGQIVSMSTNAIHRVAIAMKPPVGAIDLNCSAYLWEESLQMWIPLGIGTGNLKATGEILYFDFPSPSDRGPDNQGSSGFSVYFRVTDPGAAPDLLHQFAMAAIVNQKGY